ncbi:MULTISPECIES: FmdB family zinc ribbon protein [unclassified Brevibacterium]|uniref:FmdB family zinc ribbon protein n=1 Tax=unclassified Brevibacterium TaxID=2614124 RepID=UPI000C3C38A5|nr:MULTISPECIES: zinc ribbon domain-containing protein [unclassified Brevibacterium]SMX92892.1 putative regulatory protein, FmdB family [Brevibacterium sp. 239c]
MPTYVYRCESCGDTEQAFPMSRKPEAVTCPDCHGTAVSAFTSPHLGAGSGTVFGDIDATKKTAESPPVISRVPSSSRRTQPVNRDPRHAKLPRA